MPSSGKYIIRQGDCISSIAEERGFLPDTLWNANGDLQSKRKNPNALLPGDELIIPEKGGKFHSAATDQLHHYVRLGVPTKFRLVLERYQQPIANKQYILTVDGKNFEGTTSSTGLLEIKLPASAHSGHLRIPEEQLECELQFGSLDPVDEISGAQARLQNLGYYHGELSGKMNDDFQEALQIFQSDFGLPVTGEFDDATKQKFLAEHDEEHAFPKASPPPPDPPAAEDHDIAPDESDVPSEEEDARVFEALESKAHS